MQKSLILLFFLRHKEVVILATILLDAIFSGVQLTQSYLHERSHCEMYSKIACNISSGGYGVCVQVIQPILKLTYLFSLINYI